jgi:hypothetical protein
VAKANLTLPDGTTVVIEGSADEVASLLAKISGPAAPGGLPSSRTRKGGPKPSPSVKSSSTRKGPQALMHELATENWFKSKRTIGDVQKKLEEKGHIYALENLSTPLLRLTRSKVLRRIREKTGWVYVS